MVNVKKSMRLNIVRVTSEKVRRNDSSRQQASARSAKKDSSARGSKNFFAVPLTRLRHEIHPLLQRRCEWTW